MRDEVFIANIIAATLFIALPVNAAMIKFEVDNLIGAFSLSPLSGSFMLDTDSQSLSDVNLMSQVGAFSSGFAIDNANGFGLADTSFLFSGAAELLFEISNFDRFMAGLATGETIQKDVFVSQAANFNDNYQNIDPFGANTDMFFGVATITRLDEVSVPVPAGLSLFAVLFGGLVLVKRRS